MKKEIKKGDRILLTRLLDTERVEFTKGMKGTVESVDEEFGLISVKWDNGKQFAVIEDYDEYEIIEY